MVLLVSVTATAGVLVSVRQAVRRQDADRFHVAADRVQDSIQDRLATYIALLRATAGLRDAAAMDTRAFRQYAERLEMQRRYPGVQGIGFSQRIRADEVEPVVNRLRASGNPTFRIWPDQPRDEYHSIIHLEPPDQRNLAALGYDMFTEPTRHEAMARARDTGEPAVSGVVTLVQEIDEAKQPGFLIYLPVYEGGGVPGNVEARRERLTGFVYSPFRAGDLFAGILGSNPRPRAGFELYDGPAAGGALLYRTQRLPPRAQQTERQIHVGGRAWTARIFALPALTETSSSAFLPLIGIGGMATALLLTGLAWTQSRARAQAERLQAQAAEVSEALQAHAAENARLYARTDELLERERTARGVAEHASRMKDEFLASLSHELRTPLNAVIGWSSLILRGQLGPERTRQAVETIARNAQAQAHLVEDLLDMSRIVSGRLQLEMQTIDLRTVLVESAAVVRPTAETKRIAVNLSLGETPVPVRGDAARLQQVFWNLLSNAVKFTESGGCISVSVAVDEREALTTIADTGIGIDADLLPFVFDRFRQGDGSASRRHGGLGLGLSIVRHLAEMHAGAVDAASAGPGCGATFHVRLPLACAPHDRVDVGTAVTSEAGGATLPPPAAAAS